MSTPTWPVPYYQRVVKAYPIRGIIKIIPRTKKRKSIIDGLLCWWFQLAFSKSNIKGNIKRKTNCGIYL